MQSIEEIEYLQKEIEHLKNMIIECRQLSSHHKKEMDSNPTNFLLESRYERFKEFIQDLEENLIQLEYEISEE